MVKNDPSPFREEMKPIPEEHLSLTVTSKLMPLFFQILGPGIMIKTHIGGNMKDLLIHQVGINEDYLENRIQTIFLNGKPVDDMNTAVVENGSVIALSAAMPGLVGATMRRGGFYSSMRSQISYNKNEFSADQGEGHIILKFFNLVVRELGPAFLKKGIWIQGETFQDFMQRYSDELKLGCKSALRDGHLIDITNLFGIDWRNRLVFLQVKSK
jgi:hypothetical protein